MKHVAVRVDNLMYEGCEPHWGCLICSVCVPFHCYRNKKDFEELECRGLKELTFKPQNMRLANSVRRFAQDAMRVTNETD